MHTLTKIKLFRLFLFITYPIALVFLYPFALLRTRNKGKLFFFFDRYEIGGAQRIHIDILNSVQDVPKLMFFTKKSANDGLKDEFFDIPNTITTDIHFWTDSLLFRVFSAHYFAFYINRHKDAHVYSSVSTFFYDMLPFLSKHITKTELLHNFNHTKNGLEYFGLANCQYLNYRIVYDVYTRNNIKKQYAKYNIPEQYLERMRYIEPGVTIPDTAAVKNESLPLTVLYAGRGGEQKRVHLLDAIAKHCIENQLEVKFHFAGTMMDELSSYVKEHSILHGQISRQEDMYALYKQCHVVILTSGYEGFPMMIKESMACSCIPVVTALEGNLAHLTHEENALLIHNPENESHVIEEGITNIKRLISDANLRKKLSSSAYVYAAEHFDKAKFNEAYRAFLI